MDDDALLRHLRAAGTEEEPGAFTIDLARARARLRDYLLPQRAMYVLKLLQSAVLAGATTLSLKTSRDRVTVEHDGVAPTPSQLAALLSYVLPDSSAESFLNPLATAANAAFADDEVTDVTVDAFNGARAHRLSLVSNDSTIRAIESDGRKKGVRFVMHRPHRLWDVFATWREPLLLDALGRFAPIEVVVDGEPLSTRRYGGGGEIALAIGPSWHYVSLIEPERLVRYYNKGYHVAEARFPAEGLLSVGLPSHHATHFWEGTWSRNIPLSRSKNLGPDPARKMSRASLALRLDTSLPVDISLVSLGVTVGHLHDACLPPGMEGVVAVDSTCTDATGLKITQASMLDILHVVDMHAQRLLEAVNPGRQDRTLSDCLAELMTGNPRARLVVR